MADPRHPLAVLGWRMPWSQIEASLAPLFARKARMCKSREDADMFAGMDSADKDPTKSLRVGDVATPELAPDEAYVAGMASSINFNTVWT